MTPFVSQLTACGDALFAEHKGLTLELDTDRTWLLIYDDEGNCGQFVIEDGFAVFDSGTDPTEQWSDEDWNAVEAAL